MSFLSIGDLALSFQNNRANTQTKANLNRLSHELASGQKADISTAISGDYSGFVALERALTVLDSYATSLAEAGLMASSVQGALGLVHETSSDLAAGLLTASGSSSETLIQIAGVDAQTKFESVISTLNTRMADRTLLAGVATNGPALADPDVILASLEAAISAQTTALGVSVAIDDWFNVAGGGFETIAYLGSDQSLSPFRISDSNDAAMALTASDPVIRDTIKGFAMAALVGRGALAGNLNERVVLTRLAAEDLLTSNNGLAVGRAAIGSLESQIDTAVAQNASQRSAIQIARSGMIAIDPFTTATELEAVSVQLETLYKITARLSRLNLSDYL